MPSWGALAWTSVQLKSRVLVGRPRIQRKTPIPRSALNSTTMLSSVTNVPFSSEYQSKLNATAKTQLYSSRYWVTQPQAARTCNATILPGESPTVIYQNVEKVVPLSSLSNATQRRVLDEYPPFFGFGVGILSTRKKWQSVSSERLNRLLNVNNAEQALFLDVRTATMLKIKFNPSSVVDVRRASSITLYNAEQLDDPYKGEPQRGLAINAITGKRFAQPAHDILLGVGILRGYTSPMWVGETQLKFLNLELRPCVTARDGVVAPNMMGMIVSLSILPPACQRELFAEFKKMHPQHANSEAYFLYNVNQWELTRSRGLVRHMAAVHPTKYPHHFVNLRDLRVQKPHYAELVDGLTQSTYPIGPQSLDSDEDAAKKTGKGTRRKLPRGREKRLNRGAAEKLAADREEEGKDAMSYNAESDLVLQFSKKKFSIPYFFAEDATMRRYYNAVCMTKPHLAVPSARPIAIVNGRLLGHRDEGLLRNFALKHKLSSPIWVTESGAKRLGVAILPSREKSFAIVGAAVAAALNTLDSFDGKGASAHAEKFFNIDDFSNPGAILSVFPKTSKEVHFMLDSKWRPVLGKQRQTYLSSLGRRTPLWVSMNECLMSGFEPIPTATALTFPTPTISENTLGVKLYNSQYTTDPIRVIGLSTMLTRPQGLSI